MKIEPKKLNRVINFIILGNLIVCSLMMLLSPFILVVNLGNSTSTYTMNANVVTVLATIVNLSVSVMIGFHLARKRNLL